MEKSYRSAGKGEIKKRGAEAVRGKEQEGLYELTYHLQLAQGEGTPPGSAILAYY